jgi:hypothetical protein
MCLLRDDDHETENSLLKKSTTTTVMLPATIAATETAAPIKSITRQEKHQLQCRKVPAATE